MSNLQVIHGDCLEELPKLDKSSIDLIYIDPPFNTGSSRVYSKVKSVRDESGNVGFAGNKYSQEKVSKLSYADSFETFVDHLMVRIGKAKELLKPHGSMFVHLDYREVHYIKVAMDKLFGRSNFMNEIIWSFDYGARTKKKWPCKHNTILWYANDRLHYHFDYDAIDRIPYMSPDLVGEEKAEKGKTPTDVWWQSIVGTNSKERDSGQGYPTQKPLKILERIILTHSDVGDTVLDFFAGTGTTGEAALKHNRNCILIDENPESIRIMKERLKCTQ